MPQAESGSRVGVLDIQAVFERSRVGKRALARLMEELGETRRLLTIEEGRLKELSDQLERERDVVSPERTRARTEDYLSRLERYRWQVQVFNLDLARRHRALVAEYLPRIEAVAAPLAEQQGLVAILHQGRSETVMIVYYHAPELDLTNLVIDALDRDLEQ